MASDLPSWPWKWQGKGRVKRKMASTSCQRLSPSKEVENGWKKYDDGNLKILAIESEKMLRTTYQNS